MCAMDDPLYVFYGLPCICVLWVALYMCAMDGPVYVCYGWIYMATHSIHIEGQP
jgi:hypothetical protein